VLPGERAEFDLVVGRLCAAFNIPLGDRPDAYFNAFGKKMTLGRFSECVDFACSEEYAAGKVKPPFPDVHAIWRIHRQLRSMARLPELPKRAEPPRNLHHLANRLLTDHVISRGGLGSLGRFVEARGMVECMSSEELLACRRFADGLVRQFAGFVRERDELATPAEFLRQFMHGLDRISPLEPCCREMWSEWLTAKKAQVPFALSMAEIPIEGELIL
jgi:hypothetical protein